MPVTVALLSVLGCTVAQAPGDGHDICSGPNEAIEYPHYMRPLMDSWNYSGLLSSNVWNQVSLDKTMDPRGQVSLYITCASLHVGSVITLSFVYCLFQWSAEGSCNGGTVEVCSVRTGKQNNWLFTQHINKSVPVNDSYPVRVFVNITNSFQSCDNCNQLITVLKYFTNTQQEREVYTKTKGYTADGIMPRNTMKYFDATVTDNFYFDMDQDEDGFYFALRDNNMRNGDRGACVTVSRILVYRYECSAQTVDLVRYPAAQAPISGNVPISVECTENARPLTDSMMVNCTSEGQWEVTSIGCGCDPGYFIETKDGITACRGMNNKM